MVRILVCMVMLVGTCACSESWPVANLKFIGVLGGADYIRLNYKSDVNFESMFDAGSMRKIVTKRLLCALSEDQNFSVGHVIQEYGEGEVLRGKNPGAAIFGYVSPVYFFYTDDNDTTRNYIEGSTLRVLLRQRKKIPCKVVMTVYLSSPYYSAVMWVPNSEILRILSKDFPKSPHR
jgi:hypothetical protein